VGVYITGTGIDVPERIVANEEIAEGLGLEAEYIFKYSGIRRRRWAASGVTTSSLASSALRQALQDAEITPQEVDYLLLGTMTPDRFIPGSASAVQSEVGLREIPCLDIRASCCNMLYALQLADTLIRSRVADHVAICLAEIQSAWLDLSPEAGRVSMLFGDGASALIVSAETKKPSIRVIDVLLGTDGRYLDDLGVRCPGTEFGTSIGNRGTLDTSDYQARMVGQSVILQATRKITAACQSLLERNSVTIDDVRWLVPHQANANLLAQVARKLHFSSKGDGIVSVLEDYGNTSSASMGMALDALRRSGRIQADEYILLPAFGAGFTWGAGLCRS
jgi:3-oxoacyl-[acyl-carrier-protein] synthase-3